ncbi:nuclear transport factor 2 family protein [Flavobacterium cerinum]|uniref:Nuclear transport factor 2 family protein n=1 Tax=Flavobacterium cerinum TaxID=2502784 RepID=A0ABY5IR44_9FLAO|nr:nuclear transport factor 2 family protein [Flavobacterium cerinum]UUC45234.1 nuclear transport factor 2 family protein [Flavobacterium cerinum]
MKNIALSLLSLLLLASCTGEKRDKKETVHQNEKLIQQYFDYFNQHNWVKLSEMYTETAEFRDPSLGPEVVRQSRYQIIKKYTELAQMFPDLKDTVSAIYMAGEHHVVVEFTSSGTAPDKSRFILPICTIFTIENGAITKDFTYYDNFE